MSSTRFKSLARQIVPLALLVQSACVLDESPGVAACRDGLGYAVAPDLSRGSLRILPSQVPGIEIDSAAWRTDAHTVDIGAKAILLLTAGLRAQRAVNAGELALVYRFQARKGITPPPTIDAQLATPIYTATPEERAAWNQEKPRNRLLLAAGERLRTEDIRNADFGFYTGWRVPLPGCPATVQLIRRRDIILQIGSGPARVAAFQRGARDDGREARVLWDTVSDVGMNARMVMGIAANPSDTVVRGAVATLVLSPPMHPQIGDVPAHPTGEPADTLMYSLDPLPPRSVVGFVGGELNYGERIVERHILPSSAIRNREVPTPAERQRVSWLRLRR